MSVYIEDRRYDEVFVTGEAVEIGKTIEFTSADYVVVECSQRSDGKYLLGLEIAAIKATSLSGD